MGVEGDSVPGCLTPGLLVQSHGFAGHPMNLRCNTGMLLRKVLKLREVGWVIEWASPMQRTSGSEC